LCPTDDTFFEQILLFTIFEIHYFTPRLQA
jgi:hypothetical protein